MAAGSNDVSGRVSDIPTRPVGGRVGALIVVGGAGGGSSSFEQTDNYVLTPTDVTNKYVQLSETPLVSANVHLEVQGASPLFYGQDFHMVLPAGRLSWAGLGLDGTLVSGDRLAVNYLSGTGPVIPSPAGGSLAGTYPNPTIAAGAVGTPELANAAVTTPKITDASVTDAKIVSLSYSKLTGVPAPGPPTGPAGGSLAGTYPNPTIAPNAVGTPEISDASVTDAKMVGVAYSKVTGAPTSLPPSGAAGGALSGTYPNPGLADGSVTAAKLAALAVDTPALADLGVTDAKIAGMAYSKLTGAPSALPPSGAAGGGLTGTYPNPTIAPVAVDTAQLANLAVTDAKIAAMAYSKLTGAPSSLPPNGAAGGALSGSYPNPTLAPASVSDVNVVDVAYSKLTGAPAALPPSGAAGGELVGTYPNPTLSTAAIDARITLQKAAANGLATLDGTGHIPVSQLTIGDMVFKGMWSAATNTPTLADGTGRQGDYYRVSAAGTVDTGGGPITYGVGDDIIYSGTAWVKNGRADAVTSVNGQLGAVVIAALPPNGAAGGDLTGTYPNPTIGAGTVTDAKIVGMAYSKLTGAPAALPPSGAAGGGLTGSYPNPTLAVNSVDTAQLLNLAVTDAKIVGMAYSKLTGAPAALPPSGAAGGSLTGSYPNPTIGALAVSDAMIAGLAYSKLTGAPSALPPNGAAGGDLSGNYPNPTVKDFIGSGASHTHGAVPDPGSVAGTSRFLREDASWGVPPGLVQVENSIVSGHTTIAPSGDAVYQALYAAIPLVAANLFNVTTNAHTVATSEKKLFVSFNGTCNITLPSPTTLKSFEIVDTLGDAREGNPIVLVRNAAESIDGIAASRELRTPGGRWIVTSDGSNWWL